MYVWAYDQGIMTLYVGTNKTTSQIAYFMMMVWLYAETCSWLPEFWIYSCVWWTNVWIYVYCNRTGCITTKLRWFILKPHQFIYPQLLKILEKTIYSANVPTEIRMEVPPLPNWVPFNFLLTLVTLISVKFNAITKELSVIFSEVTSTVGMDCWL